MFFYLSLHLRLRPQNWVLTIPYIRTVQTTQHYALPPTIIFLVYH